MSSDMPTLDKATRIKYWRIYELRLDSVPVHEIASRLNCHRATVWRAVKYCTKYGKLTLSTPEEIAMRIAILEQRLNEMIQRVNELKQGWNEETVSKTKDGKIIFTQVKGKFSPGGEASYYRRILEYEESIIKLKGLYEYKHEIEDTSEGVDFDAIQEAIDGVEGKDATG